MQFQEMNVKITGKGELGRISGKWCCRGSLKKRGGKTKLASIPPQGTKKKKSHMYHLKEVVEARKSAANLRGG